MNKQELFDCRCTSCVAAKFLAPAREQAEADFMGMTVAEARYRPLRESRETGSSDGRGHSPRPAADPIAEEWTPRWGLLLALVVSAAMWVGLIWFARQILRQI